MKLASGLAPLSRAERRRLSAENRRALFPSVALQRFEATCQALEADLARRAANPAEVPVVREAAS